MGDLEARPANNLQEVKTNLVWLELRPAHLYTTHRHNEKVGQRLTQNIYLFINLFFFGGGGGYNQELKYQDLKSSWAQYPEDTPHPFDALL